MNVAQVILLISALNMFACKSQNPNANLKSGLSPYGNVYGAHVFPLPQNQDILIRFLGVTAKHKGTDWIGSKKLRVFVGYPDNGFVSIYDLDQIDLPQLKVQDVEYSLAGSTLLSSFYLNPILQKIGAEKSLLRVGLATRQYENPQALGVENRSLSGWIDLANPDVQTISLKPETNGPSEELAKTRLEIKLVVVPITRTGPEVSDFNYTTYSEFNAMVVNITIPEDASLRPGNYRGVLRRVKDGLVIGVSETRHIQAGEPIRFVPFVVEARAFRNIEDFEMLEVAFENSTVNQRFNGNFSGQWTPVHRCLPFSMEELISSRGYLQTQDGWPAEIRLNYGSFDWP